MKQDWMVIESELDSTQMKVINSVLNKSVVVSGCAGSGKSVIALYKAQRIQNETNGSCEVIVYTKALRGFIASGIRQLGLKCNVYYHWQWRERLKMPSADYVIVDEIQDFTSAEIMEFIRATRKRFFFFGDTAQSIFEGLKPIVSIEILVKSLVNKGYAWYFELDKNYRLPKPIAEITQDYIGVDVAPYGDGLNYINSYPGKPRILKYQTLEEQANAIVRLIRNNNMDDAAILVSNNDIVLRMFNLLRSYDAMAASKDGNARLNFQVKYDNKEYWRDSIYSLDFATNNPKIMTYHSAKGLQFADVFLPNVTEPLSVSDRKALYVAMTRTYRNLYIMYSGEMPNIFGCIPEEKYVTTETDEIEDI